MGKLREHWTTHKTYILVGFIVTQLVVLIVLGMLLLKNNNPSAEENEELDSWLTETASSYHSVEESLSESFTEWIVDIKGAVEQPGIYEVDASMRIYDVIQMAGGLIEEADTTQLNFSQHLEDQMMIYVPLIGDEPKDDNSLVQAPITEQESGKVNLNTADLVELQQLNGIGEKKAQKIIDYRTENGSFSSVEELMEVSGIGQKTFDALKDYITVSK